MTTLRTNVERLKHEAMSAREICRRHERSYLGSHQRPMSDHWLFDVYRRTEGGVVNYYWINVGVDGEPYGFEHGPYSQPREAYLNGMCEGD